MVIPKWYTPFPLQESWMGPFQPIVGLLGLDLSNQNSEIDRRIWELLNLDLNLNTDFAPTFLLNPNLPRKKPRREGVEYSNYTPDGLLAINWADKHRSVIPSVIVAFFKDDSSSVVTKTLGKLRDEATPFGSQLLVMLIIKGENGGGEIISTERASALCAAADIPPKSLYILGTSHPDRIHASVHRLERGIREACTIYYSGRIRRLKGNKDRASPQTQMMLQIRYNIKLGFFFEIKRDYAVAISHYESAMEGLLRFLINPGFLQQQIKVLASIINYRISRIHLLKREWTEAKTKFQKHIQIFRNYSSSSSTTPSSKDENLAFENFAYLEQQYQNFGDLVKQYYGPESMAMSSNPALVADPVSYFIIAAKYAQHRADLTRKYLKQAPSIRDDDGNVELGFNDLVGWEPKHCGQSPPWKNNMTEEQIRKFKLQLETQIPHSEHIIKHLGLASEFCKDIGHLRTRCQLMSMMGQEFLQSGEYSRCILLMGHVLREFGGERWGQLLLHCAQSGLSASLLVKPTPDVSSYLNFIIILLKQDLRPLLGEKMATNLALNLETVIERKIIPQVDNVNDNIYENFVPITEEIKSYVSVHSNPFLSAEIGFDIQQQDGTQGQGQQDVIPVNKPTRVIFRFKNNHLRPIHIKSVAITTNLPEYDTSLILNIDLGIGESYETGLEITPRDVNKVIQLQVGIVDIGKDNVSLLLHYSLIHKAPSTLWSDWNHHIDNNINNRLLNVVKVEASPRPLLQCQVTRNGPALVGEAHEVTFIWTNTDTDPLSRLHFTFFLSTTNPHLVRLSLNLDEQQSLSSSTPLTTGSVSGSLSHSIELDALAPGAIQMTKLYLKVLGETELRLISKVKYVDSHSLSGTTDHFIPITVSNPWSVITSMRDSQGDITSSILPLHQLQPFLLHHQITNIAGVTLNLTSLQFKETNTQNCIIQQHGVGTGLDGKEESVLLQPKETLSAIQLLQSRGESFSTSSFSDPITCLMIQWSRLRDEQKTTSRQQNIVVTTEIPIPMPRSSPTINTTTTTPIDGGSGSSVNIGSGDGPPSVLPILPSSSRGDLYLTGEFGQGLLKRPMSANYVLLNRSQHAIDVVISIDSTEYFMNAGPKRMIVKLNGGDDIKLSYIIFPLKTGLVVAPRLVVENVPLQQQQQQVLVVHRDHPKTVFIRRVDDDEQEKL